MKALPLYLILLVGLAGVPALAQMPVIEPGPPKTIQTPYANERRLDEGEGAEFAKLQVLHDLWRDDLRAEAKASTEAAENAVRHPGENEHASPELKRARALVTQSDAEFHAALDHYVLKWSQVVYPDDYKPPKGDAPGKPGDEVFIRERAKVMAFLLMHEKSVVFNKASSKP